MNARRDIGSALILLGCLAVLYFYTSNFGFPKRGGFAQAHGKSRREGLRPG